MSHPARPQPQLVGDLQSFRSGVHAKRVDRDNDRRNGLPGSYPLPEGPQITDMHHCAGDNMGTTCDGDSGSPLLVATESESTWRAIGAASFVNPFCTQPSGYSRLAPHNDWITAVTEG